jgi:hypothetical protein
MRDGVHGSFRHCILESLGGVYDETVFWFEEVEDPVWLLRGRLNCLLFDSCPDLC